MDWITEPKIVESCKKLSATAIKRDLKRARNGEPNITGQIKFKHGSDVRWTIWDYWVEYSDRETYLMVGLGDSNGQYEPNKILLSERSLTYGNRSYFSCPKCGKAVGKLYLPQRTIVFQCRKCWRLKYELQTINPNSVQGRHFYRMHRVIKLIHQRERVNRIFYAGRYSKRFERFLRLCSRVEGLESMAENAAELIMAIKK